MELLGNLCHDNISLPLYFKDLNLIINILGCAKDADCTGLSNTCVSGVCGCGANPACSEDTSNKCDSVTCRCGLNAACSEEGAKCIYGNCTSK